MKQISVLKFVTSSSRKVMRSPRMVGLAPWILLRPSRSSPAMTRSVTFALTVIRPWTTGRVPGAPRMMIGFPEVPPWRMMI